MTGASHPCAAIKAFLPLEVFPRNPQTGSGPPATGSLEPSSIEPNAEWLGTAGQPTEAQFADIARAGYELVVNLALPTSDGALPDEAAVAARHGLGHRSFPIDFAVPDLPSALGLFQLLDENRDRRVFVHCAANMRVSALLYAYRVARGMPREAAAADLARIWTPNATWSRYIEEVIGVAGAPGPR
jgi:protein tyrosine phosphatase (PTP) superfamily phosphohydrolase (DUF442 family)